MSTPHPTIFAVTPVTLVTLSSPSRCPLTANSQSEVFGLAVRSLRKNYSLPREKLLVLIVAIASINSS